MKRFLLAHLGTIVIACLLVAVGLIAVAHPRRTAEAFREAWSGVDGSATTGEDAGQKTPSLLVRLQANSILSDHSPAEWLVVAAAVLAGFLAGKIASAVIGRIGRALARGGRTVRSHVVVSLAGPVSLALFTFGLSVGVAVLHETVAMDSFLRRTVQLLYLVSIVWYVYNLIELVDVGFERLRGRIQSRLDAQLIPMIRKSLRVVLVLLAVLYTAQNVYDQNIGAWLAGLGIVGIAVSLAAQDSLKSFFGSIAILLDRPFRVGERIIFSGYDGVVEDIGFRSTKLRTFTGHLVTIPNANIASVPIENPGRRPFIRRQMNITIPCDTPREKVAEAVGILRRVLDEEGIGGPIHPRIGHDDYPPRVFFNEYNADSLNVQVMYWYAPPDWWNYMEHAERLNLRILDEFERAGIEFAFPTRTVYLAGDPRRRLAIDQPEPRP